MSATEERALAAVALRRLAREMRALAVIGAQSPAALVSEQDRARRAVAETRREAVHALERLAGALPKPNHAQPQQALLRRSLEKGPDEIEAWATMWEAT